MLAPSCVMTMRGARQDSIYNYNNYYFFSAGFRCLASLSSELIIVMFCRLKAEVLSLRPEPRPEYHEVRVWAACSVSLDEDGSRQAHALCKLAILLQDGKDVFDVAFLRKMFHALEAEIVQSSSQVPRITDELQL